MRLFKIVVGGVAVPALLASASPDLAMVDARVGEIRHLADYIEVDFLYTIRNVGPTPVSLGGISTTSDNDNVGIQTYLADSPLLDGLVFAASGWSIDSDLTLKPGEFFSGGFTSNTVQLVNPHSFGAYEWLVIEVNNAGEEPEDFGNNRMVIRVPAPGTITLATAGLGLAAARRRR